MSDSTHISVWPTGANASPMALLVYRCCDDHEEESCFIAPVADVKAYLDQNPPPPMGYEHRPGYYFFEPYLRPLK